MSGIDPAAVPAFEGRMTGDQDAAFEEPHLVGEHMDIEDPTPGGVGDAVEIAADADHALVRDAPLELQHGAVGRER